VFSKTAKMLLLKDQCLATFAYLFTEKIFMTWIFPLKVVCHTD